MRDRASGVGAPGGGGGLLALKRHDRSTMGRVLRLERPASPVAELVTSQTCVTGAGLRLKRDLVVVCSGGRSYSKGSGAVPGGEGRRVSCVWCSCALVWAASVRCVSPYLYPGGCAGLQPYAVCLLRVRADVCVRVSVVQWDTTTTSCVCPGLAPLHVVVLSNVGVDLCPWDRSV